MSDELYHKEPGRVRLPKEVTSLWEKTGYGEVDINGLYSVLFWIADQGYSIIPDKQFNDFLQAKERQRHNLDTLWNPEP